MINLLPPDHREYIEYGRKNRRIISWLSALLFGIVILFAVALVGRLTIQTAKNQAVSQKEATQAMIDDSNLGQIEKEYSDLVTGLSSARKVYEKQILYSRLIRKLATLLPPGTSLTTISLTDKDRAINLNFDNQVDGLGPVIQTNLLNQGDQIADEGRNLMQNGFGIPLGGIQTPSKNGILEAEITKDTKTKQIEFYVNIIDENQEKNLTSALENGGEYAYELLEPLLEKSNFFNTQNTQLPLITGHSVNNDAKSVDFSIEATSIDQVKAIQNTIDSAQYSTVIETYSFEDRTLITSEKCSSRTSTGKCRIECVNGDSDCDAQNKTCKALVPRGCRYIVRAYYDELYTSSQILKVNDEEKKMCNTVGSLPCTHKVTAKYNQLFDEVDINRVSTCTVLTDTSTASCPVEIRAKFGPNAKFYLINGASS